METSDINVIKKVASRLTPRDLAAFDVSSVLFRFNDSILAYRNKKYYHAIIDRITQEEGVEQGEALKSIIIRDAAISPLDPEMSYLIKSLQEKKVKLIALTSGKTGKFGKITSREKLRVKRLKSINIEFKDSFPDKTIIFDNIPSRVKNSVPKFYKGILFTSSVNKDLVLNAFLQKVGFVPEKIMFVDNNLSKLKLVEAYCLEKKIEFIGIHYTKISDEPTTKYDEKIIDKQFETLKLKNIWLSDEQARKAIYPVKTADK